MKHKTGGYSLKTGRSSGFSDEIFALSPKLRALKKPYWKGCPTLSG